MRLVAIADKWHIDRAEEEIGDALYLYDRECLEIRTDAEYPLIYVYSCLEADKAFEYIVREPPAYIERLIPVHKVYKEFIHFTQEGISISDFMLVDIRGFATPKCTDYCYVEVHPRNIYIVYKGLATRRKAQKRLQSILASMLGFRVSRKAGYSLIIEDTREGNVVALVPRGNDRVRFWRERRIGLSVSGGETRKT